MTLYSSQIDIVPDEITRSLETPQQQKDMQDVLLWLQNILNNHYQDLRGLDGAVPGGAGKWKREGTVLLPVNTGDDVTTTGTFTGDTFTDSVLSINSGSITSAVNGTFSNTVQAEHLYSTDDIVATDDITAGGTVQGEHLYSTDDIVADDDITAAGTVQGEHLYSTDDAVIDDDLLVIGRGLIGRADAPQVPTTGLLAYWKMNDNAASTTVLDVLGLHNGVCTENTDDINGTGKVDGALEMGDQAPISNARITVAVASGDTTFAVTDELTIAFWFKSNIAQAGNIHISEQDAGADPPFIVGNVNDGGSLRFTVFHASGSTAVTTTDRGDDYWLDDAWHLCIATFDKDLSVLTNRHEVYIDNTLEGSAAGYGEDIEAPDDGADIHIGHWTDTGIWNGWLDEVLIWNRTLTSAERDAIWNAGAGREYQALFTTYADLNVIGGSTVIFPDHVTDTQDDLFIEGALEVFGSAYIETDLSVDGDITDVDNITASGIITGDNFVSGVAIGTSPYACTSTTVNTNLNADLWDGYQFADYIDQAVKTTSSPTFVTITGTSFQDGTATLNSGDLTSLTSLVCDDITIDSSNVQATIGPLSLIGATRALEIDGTNEKFYPSATNTVDWGATDALWKDIFYGTSVQNPGILKIYNDGTDTIIDGDPAAADDRTLILQTGPAEHIIMGAGATGAGITSMDIGLGIGSLNYAYGSWTFDEHLYVDGDLRLKDSARGVAMMNNSANSRYGLKYGAAGSLGGDDILALTNREANGEISIQCNTAVAGAAGETEVIHCADDLISVKVATEVLNTLNTTEHYQVDGTQVVTNQQAHIADAPGDTAANNATTINAILVALETHGLIAAA